MLGAAELPRAAPPAATTRRYAVIADVEVDLASTAVRPNPIEQAACVSVWAAAPLSHRTSTAPDPHSTAALLLTVASIPRAARIVPRSWLVTKVRKVATPKVQSLTLNGF